MSMTRAPQTPAPLKNPSAPGMPLLAVTEPFAPTATKNAPGMLQATSPLCHDLLSRLGYGGAPSTQEQLKSLHGVHHGPHVPNPFLTLPIQKYVSPLEHPCDPAAPLGVGW